MRRGCYKVGFDLWYLYLQAIFSDECYDRFITLILIREVIPQQNFWLDLYGMMLLGYYHSMEVTVSYKAGTARALNTCATKPAGKAVDPI